MVDEEVEAVEGGRLLLLCLVGDDLTSTRRVAAIVDIPSAGIQ